MIQQIIENEQITRRVGVIGNGAHIFVPKEWVGEEVIIVKRPKKTIKEKIMAVLDPYLEDIIGAYLYGSRARGDEREDSDIDLFLITNKKLKIEEKGFEIIILEEDKIEKAIKFDPIIHSILAEAKTIINSKLLSKLRDKYKPKLDDFKFFIEDTKSIMNVHKAFIEYEKEERSRYAIDSSTSYSLILRLRGIYLIKCLLNKKRYSKKEFKLWIKKNCKLSEFPPIYSMYLAVKNNEKNRKEQKVLVDDLIELSNFLKKEVFKIEERINEKKGKKT